MADSCPSKERLYFNSGFSHLRIVWATALSLHFTKYNNHGLFSTKCISLCCRLVVVLQASRKRWLNQLTVAQKKAFELTPFWETAQLWLSTLGGSEENPLLEFCFIVFPGTDHYHSPYLVQQTKECNTNHLHLRNITDRKQAVSNYKAFVNTP